MFSLSVAAAESAGGSSPELVTEVVGVAARCPGTGEGVSGFFASLALEEDLPRQVHPLLPDFLVNSPSALQTPATSF